MSVQSPSARLDVRPVRTAIWKGVKCRCPNCGDGRMFGKWLKVSPTCSECGEDLFHERAQDFPPYITISIVGHVVLTLVLLVQSQWDLSTNTHLMIWLPLAAAMALALMQPVKGGVVGMQWALRMFGFGGESDES